MDSPPRRLLTSIPSRVRTFITTTKEILKAAWETRHHDLGIPALQTPVFIWAFLHLGMAALPTIFPSILHWELTAPSLDRWQVSHPADRSVSPVLLRTVLETPLPAFWLLYLATCLLSLLPLYTRTSFRPPDLKSSLFNVLLVTSTALRCLAFTSGFVAFIASRDYPLRSKTWLEWAFRWWWIITIPASSGTYPLWAALLRSERLWRDRKWSTYNGLHYGHDERKITDDYGDVVYTWDEVETWGFPWRDAMVRLAVYTLGERVVYLAWLRFGYADAPYVEGVSNSEILTVLLGMVLVVWRIMRDREVLRGGGGDVERNEKEVRV
jgi:hypothetical protein